MKTFLILALLAIVATTTTAQVSDPLPRSFQEPQEQPCQQPPQQHPVRLQQLDQCREFFLQQCSPTAMETAPFLAPWPTMQQSRCQVMQQQCCQQLSQIDVQSRCWAIQDVADAIIKQQQQPQQQQGQQGQITSRRFGAQSQECGQQGIFPPQQLAQILPVMCNVYLPPYCSTTAADQPFGTGGY